jgi:hypothetical protein
LDAGEVGGGGFEAVEGVDWDEGISIRSNASPLYSKFMKKEEIPIAPASSNASACTNPNPLAAPETSTTLSTRLNSGSRFVVPR